MPFSGDLQGFFLLKMLHRDAEINDKDLRMGLLTAGLLLLMLLVSNSGRDERAKRGRCCCFFFYNIAHDRREFLKHVPCAARQSLYSM